MNSVVPQQNGPKHSIFDFLDEDTEVFQSKPQSTSPNSIGSSGGTNSIRRPSLARSSSAPLGTI